VLVASATSIAVLAPTPSAYGRTSGLPGAIAPYALRGSSDVSASLPAASASMPAGNTPGPVPAGFISFCMRFADQCTAPPNAPAIVIFDSTRWQTLEKINQRINRAIRPLDDQTHYGRAEYWNIPTDGYGDCEDYALTKRKELMEAGFPEPSLRIALVMTWRNERHAVLTVSSDRGDFVLDNLTDAIVSWDKTGFAWVERQDPNRAWAWVALGTPSDPAYVASIAGRPVGSAR
jgi:predicted transglutaminase-like cysteine proteinase